MKAEIIGLNIASIDDLGVSQGSVLSPFLFNVYMTELDNFIESLMLKYNKTESASDMDTFVRKKYEEFARKFRIKRGLANILVKCGSPEIVLALYKKEHKEFFKKYRSTRGEIKNLRRITYVRYADDLL